MNNGNSAVTVAVVIAGWWAVQRDIAPLRARMERREGSMKIMNGAMTGGTGGMKSMGEDLVCMNAQTARPTQPMQSA